MKNIEFVLESLKETVNILETGITENKKWYKVQVKDENGERDEFMNREERLESLMDIALGSIEGVIEILEQSSPTVAAANEEHSFTLPNPKVTKETVETNLENYLKSKSIT